MNIYNFNTNLSLVTGLHRVLVDIHDALKGNYNCKIAGTISYDEVNKDLHINKDEYVRIKNYLIFRNSIVIVHERRLLPFFWLLNTFLFWNTKVVYVHHNLLFGYKFLSFFPQFVVAISDSGVCNLNEYFNVDMSKIIKIHNCVKDTGHINKFQSKHSQDMIKVLYPACVSSVKRQCEIVEYIKDKVREDVTFFFAGDGPEFFKLKDLCQGSNQFICLGFRNDIYELIKESDYVMLFSEKEGLPISLIESSMLATPIICNDVGGNTEIAKKGYNAFVVNEFDQLLKVLNSLPDVSDNKYEELCLNGRRIYENNFKFSLFQRKYIELINKVINN